MTMHYNVVTFRLVMLMCNMSFILCRNSVLAAGRKCCITELKWLYVQVHILLGCVRYFQYNLYVLVHSIKFSQICYQYLLHLLPRIRVVLDTAIIQCACISSYRCLFGWCTTFRVRHVVTYTSACQAVYNLSYMASTCRYMVTVNSAVTIAYVSGKQAESRVFLWLH